MIKNIRGFTLIELLVVVALIGVLSAIGLVAYGGLKESSERKQAETTLQSIYLAQQEYRSNNGEYCTNDCNSQSKIITELFDEAGFPPGVFNLVNGDGAITGDALTSHPDIDMISFTGSTRAGALISQNAAKDFKRISLELGGKGANIIFKDADSDCLLYTSDAADE